MYALPPVGIWKLVKEPALSTTAKWRVIIYAVLIPILLYTAVTLTLTNKALNNLLP